MIKRFIKDNRGQMLYAVVVTVMFLSVLSMIAMGLTLQNYHAALQKQQHVTDYYAADAAAEMLRHGKDEAAVEQAWEVEIDLADAKYTIVKGTVTIVTQIEGNEYKSWEVKYNEVQTEPAE